LVDVDMKFINSYIRILTIISYKLKFKQTLISYIKDIIVFQY